MQSKLLPLLSSVALAFAPLPALAHDFTKPVLQADGKPAHEKTNPDGTPDEKSPILTLGAVISGALLQPAPPAPGQQADPIKQAKRAALALKIREAKDLDLSADQVTEIKQAIANWPPLTVLRVLEEVDPAALK